MNDDNIFLESIDKGKFCCNAFYWSVSEAGQKGFAAIPKEFFEDKYRFVLQARSHDTDNSKEKEYVMQMTIVFCPHCGCNLDEFIANNKELVIKLAKHYQHFLLDFF